MSEVIYLNKQMIDLDKDNSIVRKIQIGEISEVTQRMSSYSYTVNIPKTSKNKQILEMLGTFGNTSRKPYQNIVCDYVVDNVYLVYNGYAIIRESSQTYALNIVDGVKSLGDLLGGKKLIDLPFDDIAHYLTTQNYVASYSNTEGFIYCIADYGRGFSTALKVEKQAPSVFVHSIFKRIFESNGLTLQGSFFKTNTDFLNEVLVPSKGYEITEGEYTSTKVGAFLGESLTGLQFTNEYEGFEEQFTITQLLDLDGFSIVGDTLKFALAGSYRINIQSFDYNVLDCFASIVVKKNGVGITYISLEQGVDNDLEKDITFIVKSGDEIEVFLFVRPDIEFEDPLKRYKINYSISLICNVYLESGGQLIEFQDYVGDMLQLDFIKDVISRYGLVLQPISGSDEFEFKQIETILNSRATAEDWTGKLSSIVKESYNSGYSRINRALYKYPDSIVDPTHDGELEIDNEITTSEKTLFQSAFEIPEEAGLIDVEKVYSIPVWSESEGEVVNLETPLKVMSIKRVDDTFNIKFFDESTGTTVNENVPFLSLDNMDMQYFLDNYYKTFRGLIENFKRVNFTLNLSVIDIYNLDFFKLKYFRQTGRFYYLDSVIYKNGNLSEVEAIEILRFIDDDKWILTDGQWGIPEEDEIWIDGKTWKDEN